MQMHVPAIRLSQTAIETVNQRSDELAKFVRVRSATLTTECRQHGLPMELAELCGSVLATVIDDLIELDRMRKGFMRTKTKQRILAAADEPALSALRIAVACSPINGRAAVAHWDVICEQHEVGKFAWLLGMDSDTAWRYGRAVEKRTQQ